jgi:hypothetical protein
MPSEKRSHQLSLQDGHDEGHPEALGTRRGAEKHS